MQPTSPSDSRDVAICTLRVEGARAGLTVVEFKTKVDSDSFTCCFGFVTVEYRIDGRIERQKRMRWRHALSIGVRRDTKMIPADIAC